MKSLTWDQVAKSAVRATLIHKPPGRGKASDIDWDQVAVREAQAQDAGIIAKWLDDQELNWIGGDHQRPAGEQVRSWMEESHVALVLLESSELIAFVNIARLRDEDFLGELGRLVVRKDKRERGVGSTLLHHLGVTIVNTANRKRAHSPLLYSRAMPENEPAQRLIRSLPFRLVKDPRSLPQVDSYNWFEYLLKSHTREFGGRLQDLRESKRLTQAQLAFLCGVRRPTINMIEAGHRLPSLELLQRLQEVLTATEFERAQLLFAAVSEGDPQHLRESARLLPGQRELRESDIWVFTDRLAEFQDERFLADTVAALKNGRQRWYFLPRGLMEDEGEILVSVLKEKLGDLELSDRLFRLYSAPHALCHLRLSIHEPNDPANFHGQIEGEGAQRVALSTPTVERLARTVRSEVNKAESEFASKHPLFQRHSITQRRVTNAKTTSAAS